jgi:chromodomain-helicase-DNA-binding protein 4
LIKGYVCISSNRLDSENDIQQLIEKTEKEGDQQELAAGENAAFSFAKVWATEKEGTQVLEENAEEQAQEDAWAQTLARIAEERLKEQTKEATGRGVRRKAAAVFPQVNFHSLCLHLSSNFLPLAKLRIA